MSQSRGWRRKKRERRHGPIPFVISFELAFLDEDLSEVEYEREVRRVVRECLPTLEQDVLDREEAGWFEEYDDRVSEIIVEELSRN